MSHKVVALIWDKCGLCEKFKTDCKDDKDLMAEISFCEKDDDSCKYQISRELSGYPTFKCINDPSIVMAGYSDISGIKDFVKKCNAPK